MMDEECNQEAEESELTAAEEFDEEWLYICLAMVIALLVCGN